MGSTRLRIAGGIVLAAAAVAASLNLAAFQSMKGLWELDETTIPSPVADGTVNGNDGTHNGTPTASTSVPPALSATSTRSLSVARPGPGYAQIPNSPTLENIQEGSYSISAWFNPGSTPPPEDLVAMPQVHEDTYAIVSKTGWHEGLGYSNSQHFKMEHWVLDAGGQNQWAGTGSWMTGATYAPGLWYHIVGVVDFTAANTTIFVNGAQVGQSPWPAGYSQSYREYAQTPWRIGNANPGNYGNWEWQAHGLIDDVRIYNQTLTLTEVQILNAGLPPPTGLIASSGAGFNTLQWTAPTGPAYGYTYNIYRSTVSGSGYTLLAASVPGSPYTDSSAVPDTPYFYVVTAVSVGESVYSNQGTATATIPPDQPDHDEGLWNDRCSCGSVAAFPAGGGLTWLLVATLGLALLLRRASC